MICLIVLELSYTLVFMCLYVVVICLICLMVVLVRFTGLLLWTVLGYVMIMLIGSCAFDLEWLWVVALFPFGVFGCYCWWVLLVDGLVW